MKRNRFSEEQIIGILKEHEAGVPVADLCRKHGVSNASIYKLTWCDRSCSVSGDRHENDFRFTASVAALCFDRLQAEAHS